MHRKLSTIVPFLKKSSSLTRLVRFIKGGQGKIDDYGFLTALAYFFSFDRQLFSRFVYYSNSYRLSSLYQKKFILDDSLRYRSYSLSVKVLDSLLRSSSVSKFQSFSFNPASYILLLQEVSPSFDKRTHNLFHNLNTKYSSLLADRPDLDEEILSLYRKVSHYGTDRCLELEEKLAKKIFKADERSSGLANKAFLLDQSWFSSIGHFYFLDSLIKGIVLDLVPIKSIIFPDPSSFFVSNHLLFQRYKDICRSYGILNEDTNAYFNSPRIFIGFWPDSNGNIVECSSFAEQIQSFWYSQDLKPLPILNGRETACCRNLMKSVLGISPKHFFTLQVRSPAYRNESTWDWNYFRNSDPQRYYQSIYNSLEDHEKCVVVGEKRDLCIPSEFSHKIINYPESSLKSELFDIFLMSNTCLHIGTESGLSHIPAINCIPTLILDLYSYASLFSFNTVWVPRHLFLNKSKVAMHSLFEIMPGSVYPNTDVLNSLNAEMRFLTQEEITKSIRSFLRVFRHDDHSAQEIVNSGSQLCFTGATSPNSPQRLRIELSFFNDNKAFFMPANSEVS